MSYECGHCEAGRGGAHADGCPNMPDVDPEDMAEALWQMAEDADEENFGRYTLSSSVLRDAYYAIRRALAGQPHA